jgi:two-component system, cell cycle response regulator DivK
MSKKILIIDDDPDIISYLKKLFETEGYETLTANNGTEGYDVLKNEKPDLVTLDLDMPNETGTGFYKHLDRNKELKDTPVIVISGLTGRNLAVREPVAVFDKPIDKEALIEAVRGAIGE